jgi:hypothetical protein
MAVTVRGFFGEEDTIFIQQKMASFLPFLSNEPGTEEFRRVVDPDPGARKLRNFSAKNALFSYFFK